MAQRIDPVDASVLTLRQAVTYRDTGTQHPQLVALRSLKDPTLQPVFEGLLQAKEAPMRVDGFLGLSELRGERGADPEQLKALGDPAIQTVAITECLGLGLLKPEGIRAILAWKDLPDYDRVLLIAELNRIKEPWDLAMLGEAASSATAEVAGLAAALALEKGDTARWRAFLDQAASLSTVDRQDLMRRIADASRHYLLGPAAVQLLKVTEESTGVERTAAMAAALRVAPTAGRDAVLQQAQADRSLANLVQCGMLMLAADDAIRADDFGVLKNGDLMPEAIAEAGAALRTPGMDPTVPLVGLMESANRPISEWAVRQAEKLSPEARRTVLLAAIDRLDTKETPSMHDRLLAALAAQQLIASDPDTLLPRATRKSGRPEIPESIVAAMCDLGNNQAMQLARSMRGSLNQRGESLALVTIAKTAPTLTTDEVRQLGVIGGGGGRVEEPIQMQAAWLYLRHSNQLAKAIAKLTPR